MIDPDALNVWNEQRLVGYLWRNSVGYIGFRYDPEWITTGGFAVSRTLPLSTEDFAAEDGIAHRFFANLLPEGGVREHIVRDLKIPNTEKYQDGGGPSFEQCYRLVQEASSDPAIDMQHLLRWQIFNVLAGNSDGHAKNLSLLYLPNGEIRLAPFYDLICTCAIDRIDYRLALDVGGERNPGVITKAHWEALAGQCDVRPRFLVNLVEEAAALLMENVAPTREAFETRFGAYPALQRIEHIVAKQCRGQA